MCDMIYINAIEFSKKFPNFLRNTQIKRIFDHKINTQIISYFHVQKFVELYTSMLLLYS